METTKDSRTSAQIAATANKQVFITFDSLGSQGDLVVFTLLTWSNRIVRKQKYFIASRAGFEYGANPISYCCLTTQSMQGGVVTPKTSLDFICSLSNL
jgi:hypothetical protein